MRYKTKDRIRNGIEGLLAYSSKFIYRLVMPTSNGFIQGNLPDVTDMISEYSFFRALGVIEKPSWKVAAAIPAIYTALEFGQYLDIIPGTFDPKDIPCYIAGGALAYGIDKLFYNKKKAESESRSL